MCYYVHTMMEVSGMINLLLTPEEVAGILGLSPFTVRRLLRQGELPGRKVGKRQWRIRRVDLEEYLGASSKSSTAGQPQPPHPPGQAQEITGRIARLAAEQGVLPVDDFDRLLSVAWLEDDEGDADDSADDFLAPIRQLRDNSPSRNPI
jgi:excisionase family DNA binding protein